MFAADVADFLDITTVVSPPDPGNLSAFGLHVSDIKRDYMRTLVRQCSSADTDEIEAAWREIENRGRDEIAAEGIAEDRILLTRSGDLRYVGEGHEIEISVPPGTGGPDAVAFLWKDFHRVHHETFGFQYEGEQDVELVNLRVQAVGSIHRPKVAKIPKGGDTTPTSERPVYWRGDGWRDCPIFNRSALGAGSALGGPAIIEEYGSTVVVPAGWSLKVDVFGNLILETRP
tara:strand:- start:2437 stop:3126 length:690 start_codon:yes stop_codon:yes gene_type:complete